MKGFLGKKHSKEAKQKMRETHIKHGKYSGNHFCIDCGKKVCDGNSKRCLQCYANTRKKPVTWTKCMD